MAKKRKLGKPSATTKKLVDEVIAKLHHQPTEEERLRMLESGAKLAERLRPMILEHDAEQLCVLEQSERDPTRRGFAEVVRPVVSLTRSPAVAFRAMMQLHDGALPRQPKTNRAKLG